MTIDESLADVQTTQSEKLFKRAQSVAPGGIQGAARNWKPFPIYFRSAYGGHIRDVDGNDYVDLWAAAGPILLGHNDPRILDPAFASINESGILFCLPHEREVELAEAICRVVPSGEKVVFGCGGSDVCLFAARAARVFTDRKKLVKCEGAYHGWNDPLLVSVWPSIDLIGPVGMPNKVADSSGLASSTTDDCIVIPFNDAEALDRVVMENRDQIAAFFVEPILHTAGCILPAEGYLEAVREICSREGIVLVFDEIITGFRHHIGGYQAICDVTPDLTALGKAMSNGFPISALAGRDEIMSVLSPLGSAYYSGTFMGQALLVEAAFQALRVLEKDPVHKHLFAMGDHLAERVRTVIDRLGLKVCFEHFGSVWSLYMGTRSVTNYRDVARLNHPNDVATVEFRRHLRTNGYYFHPPTRRAYLMDAHSDQEIDRLADLIEQFLSSNRQQLV